MKENAQKLSHFREFSWEPNSDAEKVERVGGRRRRRYFLSLLSLSISPCLCMCFSLCGACFALVSFIQFFFSYFFLKLYFFAVPYSSFFVHCMSACVSI